MPKGLWSHKAIMDIRYDYDVVVVGAGLIGSALAKYVAKENKGWKVVLIGPSEEKDRATTDIHGAYYDEGRISRVLDPDPIWAVLGERSIRRYRQIEKQSGIKFYNECGFLSVGTKNGDYIRNVKANAADLNYPINHLTTSNLSQQFPYMRFSNSDEGAFSDKESGYINPRPLVKAQIKLAKEYGCHIIDAVVDSIDPIGSQEGHMVRVAGGRRVTTRRVVLATGAFTFCRRLTPRGIVPDIYLHPNTVILVEVDEEEREATKGMPSVIYKGGSHDQHTLSYVCYILPPIKYPDGKYYLKLGHGSLAVPKHQLQTPEALHKWYCGGKHPDTEDQLVTIVKDIFPGLKMKNYYFDYCCTARTHSHHPYITMLTPSFGVVLGGNGYAAKSSDELGLIAARMICKGQWNHDLPEENFRFSEKAVSKL